MPSSRGHPEVFSKKSCPPKSCALMHTTNRNIFQIKKIVENIVLIQTLSCLYLNESSECAESKYATFNHKRIWISQDMDDKSKIIDTQNSSNTNNSAQ